MHNSKPFSRLSARARAAALALGTGLLVSILSGCAVQPSAANQPLTLGTLSGQAIGGEPAIGGATVELVFTGNTGYGTGAIVGGTATTSTDGNGNFTIATNGNTCTAPQQAYIVIQGGDTGGGANANNLLVAAIGPCNAIASNTFIVVNEATTVAAAYALGNFATTSTSAPYVNIGAPPTNAAATGSTTAAAGLVHAFLNAANLVNIANGQAYTVPPASSSQAVITPPTIMVNALANILQACVNSSGGAEGDGSTCGSLFLHTPSLSGAFPTNTFQAMANLAKNPWVSAANVSALWSLVPTTAFFTPKPSSAPQDFTLAMEITASTFPTGKSSSYPYKLTLDDNDNVYFYSQDVSTGTASNLYSLASDGSVNWISNAISTNVSVRGMAADALGNIWLGQNISSPANGNVYQVSAANGSLVNTYAPPTADAYSIAVDRNNNVWVGNGIGSNNLEELAYTGSNTWAVPVVVATTGASGTSSSAANGGGGYTVAVDSFQNIWTADEAGTSAYGNSVSLLQNIGTVAAPCYTSYNPVNTPACATSGYESTQQYQLDGTEPFGVAFDAGGSAGTAPAAGIYTYNTVADDTVAAGGTSNATYGTIALNAYPITVTVAPITGLVTTLVGITPTYITQTALGSTYEQFLAVDGAGYVWMADNSTHEPMVAKFPSTVISESGGFTPCIRITSGSCTAAGSAGGNLRSGAIDSTGSYWVTSSSSTAAKSAVFQFIGTATPTWPLQSLSLWGVEP